MRLICTERIFSPNCHIVAPWASFFRKNTYTNPWGHLLYRKNRVHQIIFNKVGRGIKYARIAIRNFTDSSFLYLTLINEIAKKSIWIV